MKEKNNITALVIGGTGGVGAFLVENLLDSSKYSKVTVITRRKMAETPKLNNILWDDFREHLVTNREGALEVFKNHDILFCCLGASEKALMGLLFNKKKYEPLFQEVDYDFVVGAANIAHNAGIPSFSVISSPSAKPNAKFAYSRIKWEMEKAIKSIGFKRLSIFRPYHLMKPARKNQSFFKKLLSNLGALLAKLTPAKQKAIKVEDVAQAMMIEYDSRMEGDPARIAYYSSDDMRELIANTIKSLDK